MPSRAWQSAGWPRPSSHPLLRTFAPGISVGELLSVLGVKHQNIQAPLRQLVREGYIQTRASVEDRRLKRLCCSRKGERLLEAMSTGQHERIKRAYDDVSSKDVDGYLRASAGIGRVGSWIPIRPHNQSEKP